MIRPDTAGLTGAGASFISRVAAILGILWLVWSGGAMAHEVTPAIGDLRVVDGTVTVDITLNAEAIVAGVDLEGIDDTNDTLQSREVDALRALTPKELADRFRELAPTFSNALKFQADSQPVMLQLTGVRVDEIGNIAQPRNTVVTLQAFVPTRTQNVALTWPAEYGRLVLRQMDVEMPYTGILTGESSGPIPVAGGVVQSDWTAFATYIPVGFDHILPKGLDHILFVLGLFFLAPRIRPLLWQVTAFTLAHSITLTLAALGLVQVPGSIVEPLIAASIVYVAIENLAGDRISTWRPMVIFGFGLLHGLGFASVLADFGLPDGQYLPALLGFNLGVEVGQVTVLLGAFVLVWVALMVERGQINKTVGQGVYAALGLTFIALRFMLDTPSFAAQMGDGPEAFFVPLAFVSVLCFLAASRVDAMQDSYRKMVAIPCSIGIALIGLFWFIERVFL